MYRCLALSPRRVSIRTELLLITTKSCIPFLQTLIYKTIVLIAAVSWLWFESSQYLADKTSLITFLYYKQLSDVSKINIIRED